MTVKAAQLRAKDLRGAAKFKWCVATGFITLFLLAILSVLVGQVNLSLGDIFAYLQGHGDYKALSAGLIFFEVRLPRTLLAILIGGSLGLAGAALQGYLRNPLAEPGIIGVSGGAALGAVLVIYTGIAAHFAPALPVAGLVGAALAALLIQMLAGKGGSSVTLILAGVAITSFTGAMTSLALNLAPSPYAALEIVFWLMGSLEDRSFQHFWLALPFILAGWFCLIWTSRGLDGLSLGPDTARSLGVHLGRMQALIIFGTALCVGAATASAGMIGFVGLVVPHLLRPLAGQMPSRLLPLSLLGGANLLLLADIFIRILPLERELNMGVVTAMIGAPFFLVLILKMRRGELS